jgi:hypothetical protein
VSSRNASHLVDSIRVMVLTLDEVATVLVAGKRSLHVRCYVDHLDFMNSSEPIKKCKKWTLDAKVAA